MVEKFKYLGKNVKIYDKTTIINKSVIEIGDFSDIADFTFIYGGKGIKIGRYCHISAFVSIIGGGELIMEDYTTLAAGARIVTGTDRYQGGYRMSGVAPREQRNTFHSIIKNMQRCFRRNKCGCSSRSNYWGRGNNWKQ